VQFLNSSKYKSVVLTPMTKILEICRCFYFQTLKIIDGHTIGVNTHTHVHMKNEENNFPPIRSDSAVMSAILGLAYLSTTALCANRWKIQKQSMQGKTSITGTRI
jgi:hypothetical protein